MQLLDPLLKLCAFGGIVATCMIWVVRQLKSGQNELKVETTNAIKDFRHSIEDSLDRMSKRLKKKVSKADCKYYRSTCPRGCLQDAADANKALKNNK